MMLFNPKVEGSEHQRGEYGRVHSVKGGKKNNLRQPGHTCTGQLPSDPVMWDHLIRQHVCVLPYMGDKEIENV